MANCRKCGAPIQWAVGPDGVPLALNTVGEIKGPNRYNLDYPEGRVNETLAPRAALVSPTKEVSAYPAHDTTCGEPTG